MKRYSITEVVPYYQPIVQLSTGETIMYECLARFIRTDGNRMIPSDINHLFESPEFLWDIFEKLFPKIIEHAQQKITIAINIDVCSITERFFYFVEHLFQTYPNIAPHIHFEVTEKNITKGMGELKANIELIQRMGSKVVLDDFGTGGANIECLEMVKFDHVKIDGQFLKAGAKTASGYKRLKLIVELLKSYNTPIVGEHIENSGVEAIAKALGIDYGQGYLYGQANPIISRTNVTTSHKQYAELARQ